LKSYTEISKNLAISLARFYIFLHPLTISLWHTYRKLNGAVSWD